MDLVIFIFLKYQPKLLFPNTFFCFFAKIIWQHFMAKILFLMKFKNTIILCSLYFIIFFIFNLFLSKQSFIEISDFFLNKKMYLV